MYILNNNNIQIFKHTSGAVVTDVRLAYSTAQRTWNINKNLCFTNNFLFFNDLIS